MTSRSGSTLLPCSVTKVPFTSTRPSLIISSAARLEATPAAASTFCSRTPCSLICRFGAVLTRGRELAKFGFQLACFGQVRCKLGEFVQASQTHTLEEVAGCSEHDRSGLRIMSRLGD